MSGLEAAADVIGIEEIAIKSIFGLCEFLNDLRDAPEQI